ncbi:sugar phosphate isomerase/epimerase, partial [candidate division WOR-3 bacterium]|nr:sugar phosphate isomerase/epimerase [candidate division WOR-3 bacterium]
GLAVLELNLANLEFQRQLARAGERRRVRAAACRQGVTLALHAIDGPSLFIPSDRVRACAVELLKQQLDWARDIGARNVVMHLGSDLNFGMDGGSRYTHAQFPKYFSTALTGSLAELKAFARGRARLCIENVGGFRYRLTPPLLARLLGPNLGLCLDIGHVNVLPPARRKQELAFFRRHRRYLHHCHVHDNSGLRDEHSALGRGKIDFLPFFRLLEQTEALVVFEVRPTESALASLRYFEKEIAPHL